MAPRDDGGGGGGGGGSLAGDLKGIPGEVFGEWSRRRTTGAGCCGGGCCRWVNRELKVATS